jgi:hypothetical protein
LHKDGVLTAYLKGAPERVLAECPTFLNSSGLPEPITDDFRQAYDDAYNVRARPLFEHNSWYCSRSRNSLVSYFVVFYKSGFSPADMQRAQKYDRKVIYR